MAARLGKMFYIRLDLRNAEVRVLHPPAVAGTPRVPRDHDSGAEKNGHASRPPRVEKSDDSSVVVRRDGRFVVEDREGEQPAQAGDGLSGASAKPRKRRSEPDERLSVGEIGATMAAVIVISFGFTALLPSLLTRDAADSTATAVASPASAQPFQTERAGAIQPVPDLPPVQLRANILPAPASSVAKAAAETAPPLETSGNVEAPVPGAGKGPATALTDLTAAEKAAVARGLEELKTTAAIAAPRRAASTRPALTEEEKAAVERGLRELEKAAGQATP